LRRASGRARIVRFGNQRKSAKAADADTAARQPKANFCHGLKQASDLFKILSGDKFEQQAHKERAIRRRSPTIR
jgi:hypothetical protein